MFIAISDICLTIFNFIVCEVGFWNLKINKNIKIYTVIKGPYI